MAGSVLGNRTRNFVLRLVVNGCKFTQSEVPNGTALPLVIEKLPKTHAKALRDEIAEVCNALFFPPLSPNPLYVLFYGFCRK